MSPHPDKPKSLGTRLSERLHLDSGWDGYVSGAAFFLTLLWAGSGPQQDLCRFGGAFLIITLIWLFNAKRAEAHTRLVQSQELHPLVRRLTTAGNMRRFSLAMAGFSAILGLFGFAACWLVWVLSS